MCPGDPAQAATLLYARFGKAENIVSDYRYMQYTLFAVSPETGHVYSMLSDGKRSSLNMQVRCDTDREIPEADRAFCEWIQKTLPPPSEDTVSVSQRLAEVDSSHTAGLSQRVWEILSNWEFSENLRQTEIAFGGVYQLPEGYQAQGPVFVVERYAAPDPDVTSCSRYEMPSCAAWAEGSVYRYCIGQCDDPLRVPVEELRYAMVCENIAYHHMGKYEKIGELYSYYTRNVLIDLASGEILAWNLSYSDKGMQKTVSGVMGSQQYTGSYCVPDQNCPVDKNGCQMYQFPYSGSGWESLLGIDDNYAWGGTAIVRVLH